MSCKFEERIAKRSGYRQISSEGTELGMFAPVVAPGSVGIISLDLHLKREVVY